MENSYLDFANSATMWFIAIPLILIVLFQAVLFMIKGFQAGRDIGLSSDQMRSGVRSGLITALGPSFALLVGLVALISLVGAPIAWMRINVIGGVMFGTLAASNGAEALGVRLGGPGYDLVGLSSSLWVLCLGSIGWMIIAAIFTRKLDSLRIRIVKGKESLLPIMSVGAVLGAFGFQASKFIVKIGPGSAAALASAIAIIIIMKVSNYYNVRWLKEWALGFAMVIGMCAAILI